MRSIDRFRLSRSAIVVALTVAAACASAQQPSTTAPAPSGSAVSSTDPALDPAAMDALQAMGAHLRTLKDFQVEVTTTDEDVLEDGQKVQYSGVTNLLAQMPTRLRAEVVNERHDRMWLYDGKEFTLFARRLNYYATVPAPPTIGQLADTLETDHGFTVPLADLFRWGAAGRIADGITEATDFGDSAVAGTTCRHYGFRQDDLDWQIWIQRGDHPLPRKLVITTKTDEARPQHTALYIWNLAPSFNDKTFTFDPPAGAGKVVLADVGSGPSASK
ncbi:MAG: DUF2092 domain-containing protein [Deltaproteobacteria bacterium]|nr:DUF2092 domain-containing protein [Deltaproteobacteria bacterium]